MRLALALAALLAVSQAQAGDVREVADGDGVVYSVEVTTSAIVQIDLKPTRYKDGRFVIELFNDDDTDTVHCSFSSSVSTITAPSLNTNYGRRLGPRSSITWAIPDAMSVYCRGAGHSGASVAAIIVATQLK